MAAEIWISAVLKLLLVIVAGHISITKIIPLLNDFLLSFIKDRKAVDSFTSLIDIFILVLVGTNIVKFILEIDNAALNYVSVLKPALDVIMGLFTYLQWILLALIVVVALKTYKS